MVGKSNFSPQEKAEVILLGLKNPDTISEICWKHNIVPVTFTRWKKHYLEGGMNALKPGINLITIFMKRRLKNSSSSLVTYTSSLNIKKKVNLGGVNMVYKCPRCGLKLTDLGLFGKQCPIHGDYNPDDENLSNHFYNFYDDVNSLDNLVLSIKYFYEKKNKIIENLKKEKYSNPDEIYNKKIDPLFTSTIKAQISLLKISVDKYANDRGYDNTKKLYDTYYDDIIKNKKIKFQRNSKKYDPIILLKIIRDIVIHLGKNLSSDAQEVYDNKLPEYFLLEDIVIQDLKDGTKKIKFLHDYTKEQKLKAIGEKDMSARGKTQFIKFIDYLIKEVIDTIREIDRKENNIN
jgi:hypothetical protein